MWRPENWKNPYQRTCEKPIPDIINDDVDEAFEAGADAILEALFELAKQSPTGKFEIDAETQWIYEEVKE